MSVAVITCIAPDCRRDPLPSTSDGTRFAMCADHTCRALSDAFGWADRARANALPPMVSGGLPIDPPSSRGDVGIYPQASVPPARQGAERALPVDAG